MEEEGSYEVEELFNSIEHFVIDWKKMIFRDDYYKSSGVGRYGYWKKTREIIQDIDETALNVEEFSSGIAKIDADAVKRFKRTPEILGDYDNVDRLSMVRRGSRKGREQ
jgi:hypothetical protein